MVCGREGNRQYNGANVLQYRYKGSNNQRWSIEQQSNGYYIIKNRSTGKVLTVQDNATWDGANIEQYKDANSDAELFWIDAAN